MEERKFPQTVLKEQIEPFTKSYSNGWGQESRFTIYARMPKLTLEDRAVSFRLDEGEPFTLRAEDAIELGTKLIEHGRTALLANMYQHQHIHLMNQLSRFIRQDRVEKITLTVIDEDVPNYGKGWRLHTLKPIWKEGKAPKFEEDFEFETVVYWSPFEEEFEAQLAQWSVPLEIIGYDREKDVEEVRKLVQSFSEGETFDPRKRIREIRNELEKQGIEVEDSEYENQEDSK